MLNLYLKYYLLLIMKFKPWPILLKPHSSPSIPSLFPPNHFLFSGIYREIVEVADLQAAELELHVAGLELQAAGLELHAAGLELQHSILSANPGQKAAAIHLPLVEIASKEFYLGVKGF